MNPLEERIQAQCLTVTVWMIILFVLFLISLSSCTSEETIDRINNLPSDDAINKRYEHVSKDAPEGLKGFYDPQLTQDLNR